MKPRGGARPSTSPLSDVCSAPFSVVLTGAGDREPLLRGRGVCAAGVDGGVAGATHVWVCVSP